jgi:hypothetical protein
MSEIMQTINTGLDIMSKITGSGGGGNADPAMQGYLDAIAANRAQTFADMIVFIKEDRLNENLRAAIARIKTAAQIQR